jgi:hypothetical protein
VRALQATQLGTRPRRKGIATMPGRPAACPSIAALFADVAPDFTCSAVAQEAAVGAGEGRAPLSRRSRYYYHLENPCCRDLLLAPPVFPASASCSLRVRSWAATSSARLRSSATSSAHRSPSLHESPVWRVRQRSLSCRKHTATRRHPAPQLGSYSLSGRTWPAVTAWQRRRVVLP